jgi:GT2 family glycosyltransferase
VNVSIAVLCHNRPVLASNCIESILRNTSNPFELVLLDNGSTDPGIQELFASVRRTRANVKILREPSNIGSGPGRAAALAHATGDALVTLDSDTEVTPGWDRPLVERLFASEGTAAVGALLVNADHRVHSLGATHEDIGTGHVLLRELAGGWSPSDPRLMSAHFDPTWLPSGAMAIKASCYRHVPFPSDRFFNCFIDANYCFELRRAGYRLEVSPESVVYHLPARDDLDDTRAYYRMRFDRAILCQSILYFTDSWGRNPFLSWGCLRLILDRPLTVEQGDALIIELREYLARNGGVSLTGPAPLYDRQVIRAFLTEQEQALAAADLALAAPSVAPVGTDGPSGTAAFIDRVRRLRSESVALHIWGAGTGGLKVAKTLRIAGLTFDGFVDSDCTKRGTTVEGMPVVGPTEVLAVGKASTFVVASRYADDICARLCDSGRREHVDFIVAPLDDLLNDAISSEAT